MRPLPQSVLAPEIVAQRQIVEDAEAILSGVVADVQSKCEHHIVSEVSWRGSGLPARRICNYCRVEEEGSHWSGGTMWSRHDYEPAILGNEEGRVILPVESDDFYKMRVR